MKRLIESLLAGILMLAVMMVVTPMADARPEYKLKAGHQTNTKHVYHHILTYYAELVKERTNGRVEIKIYPQAKLGPAPQMIDGVRTGVIQMTQVNMPHLSVFAPELSFFSMYYLFDSLDHWNRTFNNDPRMVKRMKEIVAAKKLGLKLLGVSTYGPRNMWNSKRVVKKASDLEGLKIRIPPAKVETRIMQIYGANPANVSAPEVYSALQTGVIDGNDGSINWLMSRKFYEVAPYVTLTEHQHTSLALLINEKLFNSMPADIQQIMEEAAAEAARFSVAATIMTTKPLLKKVRTLKGVTFVDKPDKASFRDVLLSHHIESAKKLGVEDLFQIIKDNR